MAALSPSQRLSVNFTVGEFQARSNRTLTDSDLPQLQKMVDGILQPTRRNFGALAITSYVRSWDTGRAHENGYAVDFVPQQANIETVFQWMATYLGTFGRIIHERDHLHVTLPGPQAWAGNGVVLREPVEGRYELASIAPIPIVPTPALVQSFVAAVSGETISDSTAAVVAYTSWLVLGALALWIGLNRKGARNA